VFSLPTLNAREMTKQRTRTQKSGPTMRSSAPLQSTLDLARDFEVIGDNRRYLQLLSGKYPPDPGLLVISRIYRQ
jgi:hypothetical protein